MARGVGIYLNLLVYGLLILFFKNFLFYKKGGLYLTLNNEN